MEWPSATAPILMSSEYSITLEEISYFSIIPGVSLIISSCVIGKLMDKFGRKLALLLISIPSLLSWLTIALANSIYILYLSRLICGIIDSAMHVLLPAYIGEISTPMVRGLWGNLPLIAFTFGAFLANLIGTYLSISLTGYVMCAVPLLFVCIFSFMPESPYFYMMKGETDKARKNLQILRMEDDVELELHRIEEEVKNQLNERGNWKDLFTVWLNLKALLIMTYVNVAQKFSGNLAFLIYNQHFFQEAGQELSASTSSIIYLGITFLCTTFASFFIDKLGRRKTMFISCAGSFVVLLAELIYFCIELYTDVDVSAIKWFPLFGMILFNMIWCMGLGLLPMLLMSELFATNVKGHALGFNNITSIIFLACTTKLYEILSTSFGIVGPIAFYTSCCLISTILSIFFMPETKGKTLEEIQEMLKRKIKKEC